jgi:curved DNA-binding protein CbpA
MKDYYKILGLKETATAEEIHGRWIELMQRFHPDHGIQGETSEERAKEINEAYQVLKYSSSRIEYDLERLHQRKLKRISIQRLLFPVSGLIFIFILFILGFIFFKRPQAPTPLKSEPQLPSSSQVQLSQIPQYEPGPYVDAKLPISKTEKMAKVENGEKASLTKGGQAMKKASEVPKKGAEPPLKIVHSEVSVKPPPSPPSSTSEGLNPVSSTDNLSSTKSSRTLEKISVVHQISSPSLSVEAEDQVAELKSPSLIATDKEVRRFFADYVERYNQKDIGGFISLFSSKAIQNQMEGLDGIRRIYDNFFNQSQELRYHMKDTRLEIYQNIVEVEACYEIDQILRKEGDKKIWRGHVQWVLVKEEGVLRIISLNYQHDKSP